MNEIAVAYQNNIPVVVLEKTDGWSDKLKNTYLDERKRNIIIYSAKTPEKAVKL